MEITILMAKANWYYRNINKSNIFINYQYLYNQILNTLNQLCGIYNYDFSSIVNIITTSKAILKDDLYGNKIKIFTVK